MKKDLLNTRELAKYLDINEKKIYSLIFDKALPATKVTGKWLFPKQLVDYWIENHIQNFPALENKLQTFKECLIIVGSNDILLGNILSLLHEKYSNFLPLYSSIGSMRGINALKKGLCHICAAHMLVKDEEEYNFDYLKDNCGKEFTFINFAYRVQGLIVAPNNSKGIKGILDLGRSDISIVNRQIGTGTRFLLDYELEKNHIDSQHIKGYDQICLSHLDVGIEILSGRADVGLGIQSIADMLNLDFIPVREERFDLIVDKQLFFDPKIQTLLTFLRSQEVIDYSKRFKGYRIKQMGNIVFET